MLSGFSDVKLYRDGKNRKQELVNNSDRVSSSSSYSYVLISIQQRVYPRFLRL